jgi:hypothetical protein
LIACLLMITAPVIATDDPGPVSLTYEVVALDGKLFLEEDPKPKRLSIGSQAVSGDRLRTGSSAFAAIGVPSHSAVFRLGAKTLCTLAHDRPGVLLHVEKGRLRALFGSYSGSEPRLVTTPSAVLAVRGTEYGVRVKKNGDTDLVVFSGVVEVTDIDHLGPPIQVEAGQQTRVRHERPAEAPKAHRISPVDWERGYGVAPSGGAGSFSGSQGAGPGARGSGAQSGSGGSKRRGG